MKLRKIISISLILIMIIYTILSCFEGIGNMSYAGQLISTEQAEQMCPGISGLANSLISAHPNYNFQFYNTGIDWNEAILYEYQGHNASPKSLFNAGGNYSGMWYCPLCGTKAYDNGSLCCASMDAIRYMMDPRNSITEDSVFQFKSLEISDAGPAEVSRAVAGTFLNDPECINAIVEASQAYNVNAFYLVAKMLTEHGTNGSTLSRGVSANGAIYYNFFNIGAYGNDTNTIITNGTTTAVNKGWNNKRASILGGAEIVRNSYIGRGQNTCYYQKFNVVNTESGLFSHQYAQNIIAAENEGRKFKSYYTVNGQVTGTHTFIIPIYLNMPGSASPRPNPTVQNSITYETAVVTANGGLRVRSKQDINSNQIGSISQGSSVKVLIRAGAPSSGYYWDLVVSDTTGVTGYVARNYIQKTGEGSNAGAANPVAPVEPEGDAIKIVGSNFNISSRLTVEELVAQYPNIIVKDLNGTNTTNLFTGYTVALDNQTYTLVRKGDVNGDGNVNVIDTVSIINHIKGSIPINDSAKLEAAKIKGNDSITVTDIVTLLNYIKGQITDIKIK